MTLSMYQASVPVFIRQLTNLSSILRIAEKQANENGIKPETLTTAQLAPDMFPLTRQVQIASDVAKGCGARLAGVTVPSFEDTEKTFDDLQARIAKTIDFLKTLKAEQIDGSESREITLKVGGKDLAFTGQDYLLGFAAPNVAFHVVTAYGILRNNGITLGKKDYLGAND